MTSLKSTYTASAGPANKAPLPAGWTEHKAPSGHTYYYHTETKKSTYTRPADSVAEPLRIDYNATTPSYNSQSSAFSSALDVFNDTSASQGGFRGGRSYQDRTRRQAREDRPKSKRDIAGCEPFVLVKTKLGRRFVYNRETNESSWEFPQNVLLAVAEMDRLEKESLDDNMGEKKESRNQNGHSPAVDERSVKVSGPGHNPYASTSAMNGEDSDSYEEVEVSDDGEDDVDPNGPSKRPRHEDSEETDGQDRGGKGPIEYSEADIAYQLAMMGQDAGLDPGEYYGEEWYEDGADGLDLSEEDSKALFHDLLSDYQINPYWTWEKITEDGRIIGDSRYTVLPNMAARRAAFSDWSRHRIRELQAKRESDSNLKVDPRVAYLEFLHKSASPKLYWIEFRRKFRKEEELRDSALSDRERERLYRDHISRLKLPESKRREDLEALLKSIPLKDLNNATTTAALPGSLKVDLRYISLPSKTRDKAVSEFIATLPPPPPTSSGDGSFLSDAAKEEAAKRRKREAALAERERHVADEKRKQRGAVRHGRELMRDEEEEIGRAMQVGRGGEGLRGYMDVDVAMVHGGIERGNKAPSGEPTLKTNKRE